MSRVSSAKTPMYGRIAALDRSPRTGPIRIPMSMRKMKVGTPVFLKKSSPPKPTTMTAATMVNTETTSGAETGATTPEPDPAFRGT